MLRRKVCFPKLFQASSALACFAVCFCRSDDKFVVDLEEYCTEKGHYDALAYEIEEKFPFPSFKMVLESEPGTCNLFPKKADCELFMKHEYHHPEPFVVEVFASFLSACQFKSCQVLDIGQNMGYYSSYALSIGATVTSLEPQLELHKAFKKTVCVNGWLRRSNPLWGMLGLLGDTRQTATFNGGWNFRDTGLKKKKKEEVPLVSIESLVGRKELDLVKVDVDSIDANIIDNLIDLVESRKTVIHSVVVELNPLSTIAAKALWKFKKNGYTILKLNHHLNARFFDRYGHDIYSQYQSIAVNSTLFREVFGIRMIKYALVVEAQSEEDMKVALQDDYHKLVPFPVACSFLVTDQKLFWPQLEYPTAVTYPSVFRGKALGREVVH